MGETERPQAEVGGRVRYATEDVLDSVDALVNHDLAEGQLGLALTAAAAAGVAVGAVPDLDLVGVVRGPVVRAVAHDVVGHRLVVATASIAALEKSQLLFRFRFFT